jgi:hypothetical protein
MTAEVKARELSQDQRRAIAYVRANGGCTTRAASVALGRSLTGMLSTLQLLEGRGIVRGVWPNRPGHTSWEWYITEGSPDA